MSDGWRDALSPELAAQLGAVWGKSDADGRMNLLLQHLFDTMAVGELIWDRYLALGVRRRIDDLTDGCGRAFFAWLCGLHDVGKATPAFQSQDPELAARTQSSGLTWQRLRPTASRTWRHDVAGARIVICELRRAWSVDHRAEDWIWPLIAGHHGRFPAYGKLHMLDTLHEHGTTEKWAAVQRELVAIVTEVAGYRDLASVEPDGRPSRADQLGLTGLIIMADWIASDQTHFGGIDRLDEVGIVNARGRAGVAWGALGLRPGWGGIDAPSGDVVSTRFGQTARPLQDVVVEAAREIPAPGLLVVEAPMGEGKTEAALAAAEVLAARFGADGIFVGMPTQATADPMFHRVRAWASTFDSALQVALLHGKAMFNEEWWGLLQRRRSSPAVTDEFGVDDPYVPEYRNIDQGTPDLGADEAPAEWYLGRKRGLLAPFVVGTIDQLLFAATRSRHVMLRYAGLAGKVVILDEVHAADVYMSQFLGEALAWLGQGQVPVVLLSATLAPDQRQDLITSYLVGAAGKPHLERVETKPCGYPSVTSAWALGGAAAYETRDAMAWRPSLQVSVELLDEQPTDAITPVVEAVRLELVDGGCVLVIRNTVDRAQQTYRALRPILGDDVALLHARFSAADRADLTSHVLSRLGAVTEVGVRPRRLVVIATQLAEQSFDVDADLLITDLAPVDLLLQRAGRLHRHERPAAARPHRLRAPRLVVTGCSMDSEDRPPWICRGSEAVYGRHHLLRSAALVRAAAARSGWSIPADVPALVGAAYGGEDLVPSGWQEDAHRAAAEWRAQQNERVDRAQPFLLTRRGERAKASLDDLHGAEGPAPDADVGHAIVRDGDASVEVVLIRHDGRGYLSLGGARLGVNGEAAHERLLDVLGGTVRLPAWEALTTQVLDLRTLDEWRDHPWLKHVRVLCLDGHYRAELPDFDLRYDPQLGLLVERKR